VGIAQLLMMAPATAFMLLGGAAAGALGYRALLAYGLAMGVVLGFLFARSGLWRHAAVLPQA